MKILFMGTPEIARACLQRLTEGGHTIVGLLCQPDKPVGRRQILTPPPTKVLAEEKGIPVFQPTTLRGGAALPILEKTRPDVCVVVAYGKILPPEVLQYPRYGCINLHVSLLPRYRGAAPMQRAIMAGERETGVTVMYMDEGVDTGDILSMTRFPIGPEDDFGRVSERAAAVGGEKLLEALSALEAGNAPRAAQPGEGACYADKITKEDCFIDFSASPEEVLCKVRGLSPAPLAQTRLPDGKSLKILLAAPGEGEDAYGRLLSPAESAEKPGTVLALDTTGTGAVTVACGAGSVRLLRVLPEGKTAMSAADFIRGRRIITKDRLG